MNPLLVGRSRALLFDQILERLPQNISAERRPAKPMSVGVRALRSLCLVDPIEENLVLDEPLDIRPHHKNAITVNGIAEIAAGPQAFNRKRRRRPKKANPV
jgi:hypothetical protein